VHMMLLGWGGDCLEGINENKAPWSNRIKRSVEVIHGAGILHGDLRTANMLWNNRARSVMLIDFERAVLWDDPPSPANPLCPISPDKRKLLKCSLLSHSLATEVYMMLKGIEQPESKFLSDNGEPLRADRGDDVVVFHQ
jgi:serine/threonine protein kinase